MSEYSEEKEDQNKTTLPSEIKVMARYKDGRIKAIVRSEGRWKIHIFSDIETAEAIAIENSMDFVKDDDVHDIEE